MSHKDKSQGHGPKLGNTLIILIILGLVLLLFYSCLIGYERHVTHSIEKLQQEVNQEALTHVSKYDVSQSTRDEYVKQQSKSNTTSDNAIIPQSSNPKEGLLTAKGYVDGVKAERNSDGSVRANEKGRLQISTSYNFIKGSYTFYLNDITNIYEERNEIITILYPDGRLETALIAYHPMIGLVQTYTNVVLDDNATIYGPKSVSYYKNKEVSHNAVSQDSMLTTSNNTTE